MPYVADWRARLLQMGWAAIPASVRRRYFGSNRWVVQALLRPEGLDCHGRQLLPRGDGALRLAEGDHGQEKGAAGALVHHNLQPLEAVRHASASQSLSQHVAARMVGCSAMEGGLRAFPGRHEAQAPFLDVRPGMGIVGSFGC